MSGLFGVANNTDFSGSGSSMTGGYLAAMDFSDNGLFFINAIEDRLLVFVDEVIGVSDVLEFFFVGESQIISEVFFQVVDQEIVLLGFEKAVVVFV
jgi:hypothetical protein